MKILNLLGGALSLGIGSYIVIKFGTKFYKGKFEKQGYDLKMFFVVGLGGIMLGIALILDAI
jgi:hypothetical protein